MSENFDDEQTLDPVSWEAFRATGHRMLDGNQAAALGALIDAADDLELLANVTLNIVCFRYRRAALDESALNWLNKELLADTQDSGIAVPSSTLLDGKFAIRVNLTNHRTRMVDLHGLLACVRSRGAVLAEQWLSQKASTPDAFL